MKKIIMLLASMLVAVLSIVNAAAVTQETKYYEGGNFVPQGGTNEFDSVKAETRDDLEQLEKTLPDEGYILCSQDNIDEKVWQTLSNDYWFAAYLNQERDKVYIFCQSYDDLKDVLDHNKVVPVGLRLEIICSTVVLNYDYFYYVDLVGKQCFEFNNNIPADKKGSYIEIRSPIDTQITLRNRATEELYIFYLTKGNPFKVKIRCGTYIVSDINGYTLDVGETSLPSKNIIEAVENTEDTPIIIDLNAVTAKYEIVAADISGQPDYSLEQNQNIPPQRTTVTSSEQDKQTPVQQHSYAIWVVLAILFVLIIIILLKSKKKKDDE